MLGRLWSRVFGDPPAPDCADPDPHDALSLKIARLVPQLDADATAHAAIAVMEVLAKDALPAVRALLSNELKALPNAPPHIIQALAHDIETAVAAPVLEFSPLLSDADLLEIVAAARAQGALEAIARRKLLSIPVADAIVAAYDVPAIQALLLNGSARMRSETLESIVERASEHVEWHRPLVLRPDLTVRAIRRLADFVAANLLDLLERRHGLDAGTKALLRTRMKDRLASGAMERTASAAELRAAAQIHDAAARGVFDADYVMELVEQGDRPQLVLALADRARVPASAVERIIASRSGKGIAALVWRAGFNARLALKVQTLVAHVPGPQVVLPRDGDRYALTPQDMRWHLEFFGINPDA